MVKDSKPRAGSLAFWPRKRARRIYPRIKTYPNSEKPQLLAFAGYKAGMIHVIEKQQARIGKKVWEEDTFVPATVIEVPPLLVIGVKFYKKTTNGYKVISEIISKVVDDEKIKKYIRRKISAIKSNESDEKWKGIEEMKDKIAKIRVLVSTQPWLAGIGKKTPEVFEIEIGGKPEEAFEYAKQILGKEIKASEVFKEGYFVDIIAVTKGKGTQGPVKRFGVKEQIRKNAKHRRHVGSLGAEGVRRVLPGVVPSRGQMGYQARTECNKRILKIGENGKEVTPPSGFSHYGVVKSDYIIIDGSVPGPKKRLIMLRSTIRKQGVMIPPKIQKIVFTNHN